jgi:hypothetical protein
MRNNKISANYSKLYIKREDILQKSKAYEMPNKVH